MNVRAFFHGPTSTLTYVVWDEHTRDAVVVDPVLDFDPGTSRASTEAASEVLAFVRTRGLHVHWVMETHAHADHLSGSQELRRRLHARIAIGHRICEVQRTFARMLDLPTLAVDGRQFDRLLEGGEVVDAGSLRIRALATPGHTPACMSYVVDDAVFTGDALFMPDQGTGRCDFPSGSARSLYASVHDVLYRLPDETRVFVGHDYQPNGRALAYETTIAESKRSNAHLREETSEAEFVALREARDATLPAPRLLAPSIRVNIDGGRLPASMQR